MAKKLTSVSWRKVYPMKMENEKFILIRKGYMFELIYEVFLKETCESLGTCIVKEDVSPKYEYKKFIVCERCSRSDVLKKRLGDIQKFINENFKP